MVGEVTREPLRDLHLQGVVIAGSGEFEVTDVLVAQEGPQEISRQGLVTRHGRIDV